MTEPTVEQLEARLSRLVEMATAFDGLGYRSSTPRFATKSDLLTGEGSRQYGGRWNPVGMSAVYASLSPETAMAETLAHNRYYGIPVEDAMPRTFVAIWAKLKTVLDLRQGVARRRLQVSQTRLLAVDWRSEVKAGRSPVTQRIGHAANSGPWEALIVPSAADPGGFNLVIFPEKLGPESELRLVNPERLAQ